MIGKIFEKIVYKFFGCFYSKYQWRLFNFIQEKIPEDFLNKELSDLGCGDGFNTLKLAEIFKSKSVMGYEFNPDLLKKAKARGIKASKINLEEEIPEGEMAIFNLSLHHIKGKEMALKRARQNFNYLVLVEPVKDWYHSLFDAGEPLKEGDWINLFDSILGEYKIYRFRSFFIIFWSREGNRN